MLIKRFITTFAALVALFGIGASAQAQMGPMGAGDSGPQSSRGDSLEYVSEEILNYDAQMFAPVDYSDYGNGRQPSTGLFFTYDRMSANISASESTLVNGLSAPGFGYTAWGNRFEFGFMSEDDHGWTASIQNLEGSTFLAGRNANVSLPMQVATNFFSAELDKTFRQQLKNGSYFEPYIGGRIMVLNDKTTQDNFLNLDVDAALESTRFQQESNNLMFGGVIGSRFFRNVGRWTVSSNAALTLAYNDQFNYAGDTFFDDTGGTLPPAVAVTVERGLDSSTFMPMGELRFDVSYDITRDVGLRAGGFLTYMFEGLTRVNTLPATLNPNNNSVNPNAVVPPTSPLVVITDQDSTVVGVTFGIEWRR